VQTCLADFACDVSDTTNVQRWCCTVDAFGLLALYRHTGVWGLSGVFAISTILFGQIWFVIAACGCCQHKPPKQRHRWELCAVITLSAFGLLAFVLMVRERAARALPVVHSTTVGACVDRVQGWASSRCS